MSQFGDTLKQIRKQKKMRQADLAESIGLSQATIANYEQGTRFPDEAVLNQLADYLGVSLDRLLGRSEMARLQIPGQALSQPDASVALDMDALIHWLLIGDEQAFMAFLEERIHGGMSVVEVYVRIIQPVMYEVGQRWASGSLDVFQEHAITEQIKRQVSMLTSRSSKNPAGPRFLGFAVSGNAHELGIRLVSDILQIGGWNTLFLGVNLPPGSLVAAIRDFNPAVIGISATLDYQLPALQQTIYHLRHELGDQCPPILVGGFALAQSQGLVASIGADALALDGFQALELANKLISH